MDWSSKNKEFSQALRTVATTIRNDEVMYQRFVDHLAELALSEMTDYITSIGTRNLNKADRYNVSRALAHNFYDNLAK